MIQGAVSLPITSPEQVEEILARGARARSTGATLCNERSSRSHAILTLRVETFDVTSGMQVAAKLNLIDLAGSENANKSQATGERLKEANYINSSLSHLAREHPRRLNTSGPTKFRARFFFFFLLTLLWLCCVYLITICFSDQIFFFMTSPPPPLLRVCWVYLITICFSDENCLCMAFFSSFSGLGV